MYNAVPPSIFCSPAKLSDMPRSCPEVLPEPPQPCAASETPWRPREWGATAATLPRVHPSELEDACYGLALHALHPEWRQLLTRPQTWEPWFRMTAGMRPRERVASCVDALRGFRPAVCRLHNAYVVGAQKLLFSDSRTYAVPPDLLGKHELDAALANLSHVAGYARRGRRFKRQPADGPRCAPRVQSCAGSVL